MLQREIEADIPSVLKIELSLRHWLSGNDMAREMLLNSLSSTQLHCLEVNIPILPGCDLHLQSFVCNLCI